MALKPIPTGVGPDQAFQVLPNGMLAQVVVPYGSTGTPTGSDLGNVSHIYGYDTGGNLTTDTATDGTTTWIKTYTYDTSNRVATESSWVAQ